VGVHQFVKRETSEVIVAQRLKRLATILDKLGRFPDMKLSRMQDIGGCRAILPGGRSEVLGVLRRIRRNRDVQRIYDYVVQSKATGYRAAHVVVLRDGRLIEIQLRTPNQHEWAVEVERVGSRLGVALKDGIGPPELVRFFERASYGLALEEEGQEVDRGSGANSTDSGQRSSPTTRVRLSPWRCSIFCSSTTTNSKS
jgi:ppGpp synthetase/RelA/SpoT-type nucleotidyltranferase